LSIVLATFAGAIVLMAPVTAAARSVNCRPPAQGEGPKNDPSLPIGLLRAHNMSCRAARAAIRRGSFTTRGGCFGAGPGSPPCQTFFRTPGFRCRAPDLGDFRCTDGGRRFRFAWGE
jgi:hypothetical protein